MATIVTAPSKMQACVEIEQRARRACAADEGSAQLVAIDASNGKAGILRQLRALKAQASRKQTVV